MARSLRSTWCTQTNTWTHYEDTKTHNIRRRADSSGKSISFRIVPSFSYAMQIHSYESRQHPGEGNIIICRVWPPCHIQMVQTIQRERPGRTARKRRARRQANDGYVGQGSRGESCKSTPAEYQDRQGGMGEIRREGSERHHFQTFFKSIGARYKRIRKRPRGIPSPQLVDLKK